MGENDMFSELGNELKQSEDTEQSESAPSESESQTESSPSDESDASPSPSSTEDSPSSDDEPSTHTQPAFPFVNDHVESIYPRPETWNEFWDVVDLDLERTFREHGVRNMSGREIHDAVLRLAAENPDELARIVLEARGIDYDPNE